MLIQLAAEKQEIIKPDSIDVCVACLSSDKMVKFTALMISNLLKLSKISCISNFDSTKIEKHFKYAKDNNAKFVVIIGDKEYKENKLLIKDQRSLTQKEIPANDLVKYLKDNIK
ncbi:MAG: hypothetical protein K2L48_03865 [Mycoplasmoidaceae bacterium]|nr:hypothetical protein [Mycoplasmoidaceae bacterium]